MAKWTKIQHYTRYSISTDGQVRNDQLGRLLKHNTNSTGYPRVCIYSDSSRKHKQCLLHRLLAVAFVENPSNLNTVDHVDGDKTNYTVENLQWVTKSENTQRAYDLGLNKNRKVTPTDRAAIKRSMANAVRGTQAALARKYNVHTSRIAQIIKE